MKRLLFISVMLVIALGFAALPAMTLNAQSPMTITQTLETTLSDAGLVLTVDFPYGWASQTVPQTEAVVLANNVGLPGAENAVTSIYGDADHLIILTPLTLTDEEQATYGNDIALFFTDLMATMPDATFTEERNLLMNRRPARRVQMVQGEAAGWLYLIQFDDRYLTALVLTTPDNIYAYRPISEVVINSVDLNPIALPEAAE